LSENDMFYYREIAVVCK